MNKAGIGHGCGSRPGPRWARRSRASPDRTGSPTRTTPDGSHLTWTNGDKGVPVWRTDYAADYDRPDLAAEGRPLARSARRRTRGRAVAVADSGAMTVSRTGAPTAATGETRILTGKAAVTGLRLLDRDRRLVSASESAVALWHPHQLVRSGRWRSVLLPSTCNRVWRPLARRQPRQRLRRARPGIHARQVIAAMPTNGGPAAGAGADPEDGTRSRLAGPTRNPRSRGAPPAAPSRSTALRAASVASQGSARRRQGHPAGRGHLIVRIAALADDAERPRADGPPHWSATSGRACRTSRASPADRVAPDRTNAPTSQRRHMADRPRHGAITTLSIGDATTSRSPRTACSSPGPGVLEVRDRARGPSSRRSGGDSAGGGLAMTTPNGSLAARLRRDGTIEVVDIARVGYRASSARPARPLYGMLPGLAFTADGAALAVAYPDRPGRTGIGRARRLRPRARPAGAGGVRDGGTDLTPAGAPVPQRRRPR